MLKRRTTQLLILGALIAGVLVAAAATGSGNDPARPSPTGGSAEGHLAGDKFAVLSSARTNRCALQAASIRSMPADMRLQGSCCFPLDRAHYGQQVDALRAYRSVSLIPKDPYDIPVSLANRLLRLGHQIDLSAREHRTYRDAMQMSPLHGPCCCHCWRWQAFSGLSTYLIHRRHWTAQRLGTLIGDLDGCGGPAST